MPSPARARPRRVRRSRTARAPRPHGATRKAAGLGFIVVVACLAALALGAGAFWITLPSAEELRGKNPASTALIDARAAEAALKHKPARRNQHWVALSRISPWLLKAVVNSEDARFYQHDGIDVVETRVAFERAVDEGHLGRGASTLTQQLAKNLWLGEERSLLRKAREALLARRLEQLGKERILELYLNVVEWGEGIYGADAAARVWFHKPAAQLYPEEAAVLAAMLPAPRKRNPRRPSAKLRKRAAEVLELYQVYKQLPQPELEAARARLTALLGAP